MKTEQKNRSKNNKSIQPKFIENKHKFSIWYFLIVFWTIFLIQTYLFSPHITKLPYSDFKVLLKAGKLTEVILGEDDITATVKSDELQGLIPPEKIEEIKQSRGRDHHIVTIPVKDPSLIQELEAKNVKFSALQENKWLSTILSWAIPLLIFFAFWSFLIRRIGAGGSFLEIGKSKAKIYMEKETGVTFKDVAGVDEAKEELIEIINFLKNPQAYGRLGARMPKGVLLVGPPGTGKTLLARAVAGEAGVPFFSISGSEFVELFVGVGAARVRDLFERARTMAPAIIFIDELDALGRARGAYPMSGGHDEKEQTLNQLLAEMDGFDPSVGLILLAATNRPEILDPALLRAGRFDRHILVDRPDKGGRVQILAIYLKKIQQSIDVDPEKIAALTSGFSGADLANLVNEAALLATRRNAETVTLDDFTRAIERIVAGLEKKNRLLNQDERKVVAYHEMGHALVALSLPGTDKVHKVSIIPRGIGSLGYTIQRPTEDRYLMTREELQNKMAVLLGGRAAESVIFGHFSTGAADDLAKVTDIARSMVMHYGMHEPLGHVVYESQRPTFLEIPSNIFQERNFSEDTAKEIDKAIREIIQAAFDESVSIIKDHRKQLEEGAQLLLQKETLSEDDLTQLMDKNKHS
jgi:cell division protease FtsH